MASKSALVFYCFGHDHDHDHARDHDQARSACASRHGRLAAAGSEKARYY